MTPLPAALAPEAPIVAWRVDAAVYRHSWNSGIGAERGGGRWNPKGLKVVYCSFDPATTILESAVHRGFHVLDSEPFVLTTIVILDAASVKIVLPEDVPNPAWLHSGIPSSGQQAWGAACLDAYPFVAFPRCRLGTGYFQCRFQAGRAPVTAQKTGRAPLPRCSPGSNRNESNGSG